MLSKQLFLLIPLTCLAFIPAKAQDSTNSPIVDFSYIEPWLQPKNNDTTYIINFWATWCKPCVKELPYFDTLQTKYATKKIKVFLVSLDFTKNHQKMLDYLVAKKISTQVVLLNAQNANDFIDKVSTNWSGAIPATLILKNQRKEFYESEFTRDELFTLVDSFIQ